MAVDLGDNALAWDGTSWSNATGLEYESWR